MNDKLEKQLFDKYPKIFSGKDLPITENLMSFGCECNDGWYWIIDNLCESIQSYIDNNPHLNIPQVVATQVKEKFGGLRFYINGGDKHIDGMISLAEDLSYKICEYCGSKENVTQTKSSWIKTLCENCQKEK